MYVEQLSLQMVKFIIYLSMVIASTRSLTPSVNITLKDALSDPLYMTLVYKHLRNDLSGSYLPYYTDPLGFRQLFNQTPLTHEYFVSVFDRYHMDHGFYSNLTIFYYTTPNVSLYTTLNSSIYVSYATPFAYFLQLYQQQTALSNKFTLDFAHELFALITHPKKGRLFLNGTIPGVIPPDEQLIPFLDKLISEEFPLFPSSVYVPNRKQLDTVLDCVRRRNSTFPPIRPPSNSSIGCCNNMTRIADPIQHTRLLNHLAAIADNIKRSEFTWPKPERDKFMIAIGHIERHLRYNLLSPSDKTLLFNILRDMKTANLSLDVRPLLNHTRYLESIANALHTLHFNTSVTLEPILNHTRSIPLISLAINNLTDTLTLTLNHTASSLVSALKHLKFKYNSTFWNITERQIILHAISTVAEALGGLSNLTLNVSHHHNASFDEEKLHDFVYGKGRRYPFRSRRSPFFWPFEGLLGAVSEMFVYLFKTLAHILIDEILEPFIMALLRILWSLLPVLNKLLKFLAQIFSQIICLIVNLLYILDRTLCIFEMILLVFLLGYYGFRELFILVSLILFICVYGTDRQSVSFLAELILYSYKNSTTCTVHGVA